jgi:hypothetical protein
MHTFGQLQYESRSMKETWIEKASKASAEVGAAIGDLARSGDLEVEEIDLVSFHGGVNPSMGGGVAPTIQVHFRMDDRTKATRLWAQIVEACPYAQAEGISIVMRVGPSTT